MLHVTNGDSAVAALRAAGIEGTLLPWQDVLHEGPVPAHLDEAGLRDVRARFLASLEAGADESYVRADMELRDRRLSQAVADGEPFLLWFEPDLYDMLQLAQILDRLPEGSAELVIVGEERFVGVAELAPDELRALAAAPTPAGRGRRIPVDEALRDAGRALWAALRAPEPTTAARLADAGTPPLPALSVTPHGACSSNSRGATLASTGRSARSSKPSATAHARGMPRSSPTSAARRGRSWATRRRSPISTRSRTAPTRSSRTTVRCP